MRKVLYGLGVITAVLIVTGIVGFFILGRNEVALDRTSKAYVHDSVIAIASNWDVDQLWKRAAPDLRTSMNEDMVRGLFNAARGTLGPLVEYRGSEGEATIWLDDLKTVVFAKYVVQCRFQKGDAVVQVFLIKQHNNWMIEGFHIRSSALMRRPVGIRS